MTWPLSYIWRQEPTFVLNLYFIAILKTYNPKNPHSALPYMCLCGERGACGKSQLLDL